VITLRVCCLTFGLGAAQIAEAQQISAPPRNTPPEIIAAYAAGTRNPAGVPGPAYWQLWPSYDLEAVLNAAHGRVDGRGMLRFRNTSPHALKKVVLRLDQNRFISRNAGVKTHGIVIRHLAVDEDTIDLSRVDGLHTTIATVSLVAPLEPGDSLTITYEWTHEVPLDQGNQTLRQGRIGTTLFQIAQWYPRLAMYDDLIGWDTAEHDGSREFNNPFGDYRVRIQVPDGWLVGASGTLTNPESLLNTEAYRRWMESTVADSVVAIGESSSSTKPGVAWEFQADSVRDFAWGASSEYAWLGTSRALESRRITVFALATPRHQPRLKEAVSEAADLIVLFSNHITPYAWPFHTLLDGPEGGMEYPGLTMSHGGMLGHELAHQWYPMVVGTDETRFDFLDEGFATFYSGLESRSQLQWSGAEPRAALGPLLSAGEPWAVRPVMGYGRGSRMLRALGERIGTDHLLTVLAWYVQQWQFRHPTPWDFMAVVESQTGEDLQDFWAEWLYSDAAITRE
jgi:hypothetical protein